MCCRLCTYAILYDWPPFGTSSHSLPLAMAVVRRLGQDRKHLAILDQKGKQGHHPGWSCPGCNDCCGVEWQWRTELVATILPQFGERCDREMRL